MKVSRDYARTTQVLCSIVRPTRYLVCTAIIPDKEIVLKKIEKTVPYTDNECVYPFYSENHYPKQ